MKTLSDNITQPDYNNSIVNLVCSIQKYFGAEPKNNTLPALDNYLKDNYNNIVLLVLGGVGSNVIDHIFGDKQDSLFVKNKISDITSVFPSTTTTSTTSLLSGLKPNEHAWIGNECYFSEVKDVVSLFTNNSKSIGGPVSANSLADILLKYTSINETLQDMGVDAYTVSPSPKDPNNKPSIIESICDKISDICHNQTNKKQYIYGYFGQLDTIIHNDGLFGDSMRTLLDTVQNNVEKLVEQLKGTNTLLIITADHGLAPVNSISNISEKKNLLECLDRQPCLERRVISFSVKYGFERKFEQEFEKEYGNHFKLYTRSEMLHAGLLGNTESEISYKDINTPTGKIRCRNNSPWHFKLESLMGTHIAVAVSDMDIALINDDDCRSWKCNHGGLTKDEMVVPLIVCQPDLM